MKKVKTMVALTVVIILCATMLMACGQPAQQETNTEPTQTIEASAGASESAAQGTGTADGNAEDVSLYFILKTFSNPFHVAIADAIKAEAEAQGVTVFVDAMNSEDEATPQLDKLMTAVNSEDVYKRQLYGSVYLQFFYRAQPELLCLRRRHDEYWPAAH